MRPNSRNRAAGGLIASICTALLPIAAHAVGISSASASLIGPDGKSLGKVLVAQTPAGLHVLVTAAGLAPGVHGVHIHTTGSCTPPDFKSAGGHWNPTGKQHGKDNPAGMHMGDLPNLTADANGNGTLDAVIPGGMLSTGANPLLDSDGAAVVVHAGPDDYKSDPAGNSGNRIACGVLAPS
ncbi:MAG: superoxide dismutase family protein [Sphingomonadaceae bacterium]|nr:superoxide dismutase family protein [Sphingomonadaceae bacterium]